MTSTAPPVPTPVNASSASSATPSAALGTTQRPPSYANATKGKQLSPPANALSASPAAVGGLAASQHATHSNTVSPVNGRPSVPPAVPGPAIVNSASITNGAPVQSGHGRKPSVTISDRSGYPNGSASGPSPRLPISFGSINNAAPSPSMANSTPHMHHNSLSASMGGPGPARSPSPIPQPAATSGGRLPSTLSGQGSVSFGSLQGAEGSDQTLRPAMPQGPASQLPTAQHLRRESSQSAHSDMSASMNRGFNMSSNGRGGGGRGYNPQFPGAPVAHSPNVFRPGLAMGQRTPSNVPQYGQQQMRGPNSPYQANRSPAMPPAGLHQQPHMQNGPPVSHPYGYPHNLHPQNPGMYVQPDFNQQAYAYGGYPQPFMQQNMPNMPFPGAPPSPRPFHGQQHPGPATYIPGPYQPPAQGMSRTSSQGPERPSSTLGQPPTTASHQSHTPGPTSSSPVPAAPSFTRPEPRKSKAVVIKTADGQVVDFKKGVTSPAPATQPATKGPVVVSSGAGVPSTSTPPPPRAAVASPQHSRTESQATKSAEEKKAEFQATIQRQLEAEKAEKQKKEDEEKQKALKEKEAAEQKAREEEEARAAKEKEEAERAEAKAKADSASAEDAKKAKEEEERRRQEEEEQERWIAELEAQEREEEERERAYQEKKKREKEEKAKKLAEAAANEEEELRRQEREAEEREAAKAKDKHDGDSDAEANAALFAQLKKNTLFGPQAGAPTSGTTTPGSESSMPPPVQPVQVAQSKPAPLAKSKPTALKLETTKPIEPAQPTAGMQSLKSARFLQVQNDSVKYPVGIQSPNPALNQSAKSNGQRYDKNFLLQFQSVFREKPSIDWEKVIKETVGDSSESARPQSARTPSVGGRQMSGRPGIPALGAMGSFGSGGRTIPAGTTSEQRFQASMQPSRGAAMPGPFGAFAGRPGAFPMTGAPGMVRTPSSQSIANTGGMSSPRNASQRGKGSRRGGPSGPHPAQEAEMRKKMPLTADAVIAPLEVSKSGWKPASIVAPQTTQQLPGGHMQPDMVQRKVKAALNKMTPEKFDKIATDILQIASQSKDETDGRTLRQIIQLTFEKACDEAHWASMYAKFCKRMLEEMGPEIRDEALKDRQGNVIAGGALFRKYLLNRCQEEFERGWEVNLPDKPEGQDEAVMLSDDYYIAAAAKRRGLGLIQFIGELYKLGMLTLRIMHECVVKLLNFEGLPDEAAVESLVKLLRTIGSTMDSDPKGHAMIDTYMERITSVMTQDNLPSRTYYMLLDTVDLRRKQWRSKDDAKGPKTIQEIREDAIAAQQAADLERQRTARAGGRPPAGRGDARSFSSGMPPPDYPRNQVGMDDLKKLTRNARNTSQGPGALGPTSLLGSRSSSGRRAGLGPLARGGDDSGASSRTGTPPVKEKESTAHVNAYSALAGLDASGDHTDDVASPPSTSSSPQVSKALPAKAGDSKEADTSKA